MLRIAERMAPCKSNEEKVVDIYREALAKELGVSVDSGMVQRAETVHLRLAASSLTDKICRGELDLKTDAEIGDAFKKLVSDHAREHAGLLGKADTVCQSPVAARTLKRHILALGKTNKFDFDKFKAEAGKMKPLAEKVAQLIDSKASVDSICNAIGDVFQVCKEKVYDLLHKQGQFDDVGPDDFATYGIPMQILAMDAVPGLMDKIQALYEREDVRTLDFEDLNGVASRAKSLFDALDRVEEFDIEFGTGA